MRTRTHPTPARRASPTTSTMLVVRSAVCRASLEIGVAPGEGVWRTSTRRRTGANRARVSPFRRRVGLPTAKAGRTGAGSVAASAARRAAGGRLVASVEIPFHNAPASVNPTARKAASPIARLRTWPGQPV